MILLTASIFQHFLWRFGRALNASIYFHRWAKVLSNRRQKPTLPRIELHLVKESMAWSADCAVITVWSSELHTYLRASAREQAPAWTVVQSLVRVGPHIVVGLQIIALSVLRDVMNYLWDFDGSLNAGTLCTVHRMVNCLEWRVLQLDHQHRVVFPIEEFAAILRKLIIPKILSLVFREHPRLDRARLLTRRVSSQSILSLLIALLNN